MGLVLLNLMEVGTEQHQCCGQGRTTAEPQRIDPWNGLSATGWSQHQQSRGGGKRTKGQPTQRFPQPAIAQPERRPLIDKSQATANQHQRQH